MSPVNTFTAREGGAPPSGQVEGGPLQGSGVDSRLKRFDQGASGSARLRSARSAPLGHKICYIALHSAYIVHYMHKEAPDSAPLGSLGSLGSAPLGSARLRSAPLGSARSPVLFPQLTDLSVSAYYLRSVENYQWLAMYL